MIVLDTNVLSEVMRVSPAPRVSEWLRKQPPPLIFTTTITQAEMLYGIEVLEPGQRRSNLELAARRMFADVFDGRVLTFDGAAAVEYASIAAARKRAGRPISQMDAEIAAIARSQGMSLATRNVDDFDGCGIDVIDPWNA